MDTKTLTTFKETRQTLINEYNKAKGELATMEKELVALGIIQPSNVPAVPSIPPALTDGIKSELSKKILMAVTNGAKTQKEIEKVIKKSPVYGKLQNMVEQKLLKKNDTAEGVTYTIPQ